MLFEPLKSAEPPINSFKYSEIFSKTKAEDFLEAWEDFKSNIFFLIDIIFSLKSLGSLFSVTRVISSLIFLSFLL